MEDVMIIIPFCKFIQFNRHLISSNYVPGTLGKEKRLGLHPQRIYTLIRSEPWN